MSRKKRARPVQDAEASGWFFEYLCYLFDPEYDEYHKDDFHMIDNADGTTTIEVPNWMIDAMKVFPEFKNRIIERITEIRAERGNNGGYDHERHNEADL